MPDPGLEPPFESRDLDADEFTLLRECVAFEMANALLRAQWKGRGTGYQDPRYVALLALGRKLGIEQQ